MTRHILGVLGVVAALVLLGVSMMMNYKFGASLGKTATDQQIYGMASAAADCFKALAPFFFFAAVRNRVWSQAIAAAVVWAVVTVYAFTSAIGHAALNRFDTSGQRVAASTSYKDTRAELQRAEEQLKWIPPHRPPSTVESELNVLKAQRPWLTTKECTDATARASRDFCQQYFKLSAEYASGHEAAKLNVKIAELSAEAGKATGAAVLGLPDPQANVIARVTGVDLETVQTGLMLFVALLIEIGSGFGMYVAFAYWRPHHNLHAIGEPAPPSRTTQREPGRKAENTEAADSKKNEPQPTGRDDPIWTAEPATGSADAKAGPPPARPFGDNDNKTLPRWIMPENDVEMFYRLVEHAEGESVTSQDIYDAYKAWAKGRDKRQLNHSRFSQEFEKLGHKTVMILERQRYPNIKLKPELQALLDQFKSKSSSFRKRKPALGQEAGLSGPKPAGDPNQSLDEAKVASDQLRAAAEQMRVSLEQQPEAGSGKAKAA